MLQCSGHFVRIHTRFPERLCLGGGLRIGGEQLSNVPASDVTRILVRVTRLDARVREFATALEGESGHPVSFLLDERNGPATDDRSSVVGLSDEKCRALGLFLPNDYAWRCGDYGYYLARQQYPRAPFIWMIEFDVRFSGDRLSEFFGYFASRSDVDFLATGFMPAEDGWFWAPTCFGRGIRPYRCFFPITRLSAPAIDALLDRRRAHSRSLARRRLWPNDEAMVATTLANGGFACRDFNDFGTCFYDSESFTFFEAIDGDSLVETTGPTRMLHPVLYGAAYRAKVEKLSIPMATESRAERWTRRLAQKVNRSARW